MNCFRLASIAAALLVGAPSVHAAVNFTGSTYTQNFDSLATTGAANAWVNDSTLAGWSLFRQPAPGTAITAYGADTGSNNAGNFYSYGAAASSDRALGGLGSGGAYFGSPASGTVAGWIAVALQNTSGAAFSDFTVSFRGEQWRNGGNTSAQTMVLQYGFGSSFNAVTWTAPGAAFNWSSVVNTATAAAVNGNVGGLVASVGGTVNTLWANGSTLWVRWIEDNNAGNDHGLAIDNFSLNATVAVPEPETYAMLLAGLGLIGFAARRRNK